VYNSALTAWQAKPSAQSPFYTSDTPPVNPVVGDAWFNTNDGTMYIYFNDGNTSQWVEHRSEIARSQVGLVPVIPTSLTLGSGTGSVGTNGEIIVSGASSVIVNNAFSGTYKDYLIKVTLTGSGSNTIFRFVNSAGTILTSGYAGSFLFTSVTGTTGAGSNSASGIYFDASASASADTIELSVSNPFLALNKSLICNAMQGTARFVNGGLVSSAVSYPSFVLTMASGNNLSARIKVYGYTS
jgi:hypothetical protein